MKVGGGQMFGFLRNLFQRKPLSEAAATTLVLDTMRARAKPTLMLDGVEGDVVFRLGGLPRLPSPNIWPLRDGRPLAFIGALDLHAMRAAGGPDYLPAEGHIHVFYDVEGQPWGFDPADRDGFALVFTRSIGEDEVARPRDLSETNVFASTSLKARAAVSYPTPQRLDLPEHVGVTYGDDAAFDLQRSNFGDGPEHRIGGYPTPIQNDSMELEAELASSGVYLGDPAGYSAAGPGTEALARSEWFLLLQIDSDDDAGIMWGDSGMLYIWVRERDARRGNFDNAWFILQCC